MVLDIPGSILGKDEGLFKKSPEDTQVDKYEGGKKVPSADEEGEATKEYFEPVMARNAALGDFGVLQNLSGSNGYMVCKCPHDFTTLVSAEVIIIPAANDATANIDVASDYAADGEAYNTHSESDTASTYNLTANQIFGVDVSGILTSLAAGDFIGIKFTNNEVNVANVLGFRLRYT